MNESSRGLQLETEKQQVWRRVKESPGWRQRAGVEVGEGQSRVERRTIEGLKGGRRGMLA